MNRNNLWLDACVFNCAMSCQVLWDRFLDTYDRIMEQDLPVEQLTNEVNVELDKVHKKTASLKMILLV